MNWGKLLDPLGMTKGAKYAERGGQASLDVANQQKALQDANANSLWGYTQLGSSASEQLKNMLSGNFDIKSDPTYKAQLQSGTDALSAAGAAAGNLGSGNFASSLEALGQNIYAQNYGDQFNRLLQLAGLGEGAQQSANEYRTQGLNALGQGTANYYAGQQQGANERSKYYAKLLGAGIQGASLFI